MIFIILIKLTKHSLVPTHQNIFKKLVVFYKLIIKIWFIIIIYLIHSIINTELLLILNDINIE